MIYFCSHYPAFVAGRPIGAVVIRKVTEVAALQLHRSHIIRIRKGKVEGKRETERTVRN